MKATMKMWTTAKELSDSGVLDLVEAQLIEEYAGELAYGALRRGRRAVAVVSKMRAVVEVMAELRALGSLPGIADD